MLNTDASVNAYVYADFVAADACFIRWLYSSISITQFDAVSTHIELTLWQARLTTFSFIHLFRLLLEIIS